MTKNDQIVNSIVDTFDSHLGFLRHRYQYHYALRRFRVDNNSKYVQPILTDFQMRSLKWFPKLTSLSEKGFIEGEATRMANSYPDSSEKKALRKKVYLKNPQILFYNNLLLYLFLAKTYYLDFLEGFKEEFEKAINHLKEVDFENILFDEGIIEHNPSAVANCVYYLQFLEVVDLEDKLHTKFKAFWLEKATNSALSNKHKVYAMTHVIIAASYYYQRILKKDKFDWILTFFEKEFDWIVKNTNADIVGEVGLCFRLCGLHDHEIVKKASDHVISKFDEKEGLIPKEEGKSGHEKLEHRNSVSLLLLSDYEEFCLGPNLYILMREKGRTLYLPEKGKFVGVDEDED